ncbi:MAG: SatD family protein [Thermoplasmatota archaeon]
MAVFDADVGDDWTVVIADVEGSRDTPDRAALQKRLLATLKQAATTAHALGADAPAAGPDVTAGDEWQAVFHDAGAALRFLSSIRDALPDVPFRAGIGHGTLALPPTPGTPVGHLDGPAFHQARAAIDEAKRRRRTIQLRGFGDLDHLLTLGLDLAAKIRRDRTPKQRDYVAAVTNGATQQEVAARFGVTGGTVSLTLQRARHEEVRRLEEEAARTLAGGPP